jgi:NAD(P)-dependent dehydrogenase (short-subunit alcohol dehydrogenase family)
MAPTVPDLSREFDGRRAVITGGSRGIGAAIARRLLDAGCGVVVAARSPDAQTPDDAVFIASDLRSEDGARALAEQALEVLGGVDILVNNAGAARVHLGGGSTITDDDWLDSLNINFLAAVRLTAALLPALQKSAAAAIINVSAVGAAAAPGPLLDYVTAKAALNTYSRGLAQELAPSGIRVNVLTAGPVISPGADALRDTLTGGTGTAAEAFAGIVPLGSLGEATDVAEMAALLASDRGRWMTSANYFVDGGYCGV